MAAETFDRKDDGKTRKQAKAFKGRYKWPFPFKKKDWPFAFPVNPDVGRIDLWAGNPDREDD